MLNTSTDSKLFDPENRLDSFLDCVAGILARQWLQDQRSQDFQEMHASNDRPDRPRDSDGTLLSGHVSATCDTSSYSSP
ncbi:MAG: hypothetical protein JWN70_439 [Planctomycetaceae bacterium]|nr:hypothetical protein [Planctomycetaceae bacterium]